MFSRDKVKLESSLYERAVKRAKALGLPSVDAYVAQVLEKDVQAGEEQALKDKVLEQMKGLGYLQ